MVPQDWTELHLLDNLTQDQFNKEPMVDTFGFDVPSYVPADFSYMRMPDSNKKARKMFRGLEDVSMFFAKHPTLLVAYVETGVLKQCSIVGTHAAQLAKMVNIQLRSLGRTYTTLPTVFVLASDFDNIGDVIIAGKAKFYSS